MRNVVSGEAIDLWDAWIDASYSEGHCILYVIADIHLRNSKAVPVMQKKTLQGVCSSHLILEVMPTYTYKKNRSAEVIYSERVGDIKQYRQISICAGEDIIARINTVEVIY